MTPSKAIAKVRSRGIEIVGARIEGTLHLAWVNLPFPLRTFHCVFTDDIFLDGAKLASLQLQSTYIKSLNADALTVDRDITFTDGFRAAGPVSLQNATINGLVDCEGGQFNNGGSPDAALNLQGAKTGSVLLGKGFVANGEVRMRDATIGGTLNCDAGCFSSSSWDWSALDLEGAKTGFVILSNSHVWGKVWLYRVTINGNLECDHAVFVNLIDLRSLDGNAYALNFDYAKTGNVLLQGVRAVGTVSLLNATLDGSLECDGAKFIHPQVGPDKEVVIRARESFIKGSVRLVNVYVDGRADFGGSQIDHDLRLEKATWEKPTWRHTAQLDLSFAKAKTLLNAEDSWPPTQDSLDLDGFTFDALRPELDPITKTPTDPQAETETSWIERQLLRLN